MAILDSLLRVSDAQAVTATALSTSSIDLGNTTVKRQIATGEQMGFLISVDVAADHTTGDETYEIDIVTSANADLSASVAVAKFVMLFSDLKAGAKAVLPLPQYGVVWKRYIGLNYVQGGTTPTLTVTADFGMTSMLSVEPTVYPKNYAV